MKYPILLALTCFAFTNGSPAPDDTTLVLPPEPAGESLSDFLDQLFPDSTATSEITYASNSTNKRSPTMSIVNSSYTNAYGLHQSHWDNDTDGAITSYNISVDFSACATGLNYNDSIGVYTFTNGTTNYETPLRDMIADLYSLRHSRQFPNLNYANHTGVLAQLAIDEANAVLTKNGLICNDTTGTSTPATDELVHNELRRLLQNSHSYWLAVILSSTIGALAGGGIAALVDVAFKGNVTSSNVVQTAAVVGTAVIIGGILSRCHEVGHLDNAQDLANNVAALVPQGREAVVQNVYIGWARRQLRRLIRREVEQALSDAANAGTGTPQSTVSGAEINEACLSELEAGQAATAVGEMREQNLELEPIHEVQQRLGARDEAGHCNV